jgi:hypothetical protein
MKFIQLSPVVTVNVNEISWIASSDDGMGCTIFIGGKEFPSDIPYNSILNIIQQIDDSKTMEKLSNYLDVATVTTL